MGTPSAALGLRPTQFADPMKAASEYQRLQAGQQQLQMGQQELKSATLGNQQREQDLKDQQIVQQVLAQTQGDISKALPILAGKVTPKTFMGIQKYNLDTRKTLAEISDKELAAHKDVNDRTAQLVDYATKLPDDQYMAQWPQIAAAAKQLHPDMQIDLSQPIPKQQLQGFGLGLLTTEQYIKQEAERRAVAKEQRDVQAFPLEQQKRAADALQAQKVTAGTNEQGMTAAQQMTTRQAQQRIAGEAAARAETARHNKVRETQQGSEPTADEKRRGDLAANLNENLDALEEIANRRPDLFGPIAGRITALKSAAGTSDPDVAALETIKHQIGMAQISAHGMRSAQGIAGAAVSVINNFKNSPEATKAAIQMARGSVATFINDANRGKQASATATPAAQQGRPVYQNGKIIGYTTDGKTMTPATPATPAR